MKSTKIFSAVIFTAALAAFSSGVSAADITNVQSPRAVNQWEDMTSITSTKTRAEVRSELSQAQSKANSGQQEYVDFSQVKTTLGNCCAHQKSEITRSSARSPLSPGDVYYGA